MSYRVWIVDEKELSDEIIWQSKQPQNAKPMAMDVIQYEKLIRKLSYWYIIRDRVMSMAIISVLLIIGLAVAVYITSSKFSLSSWAIIIGAVIAVHSVLYGIVVLIYQMYRKKFVY